MGVLYRSQKKKIPLVRFCERRGGCGDETEARNPDKARHPQFHRDVPTQIERSGEPVHRQLHPIASRPGARSVLSQVVARIPRRVQNMVAVAVVAHEY